MPAIKLFADELKSIVKTGRVYIDEPMKTHTSFRVGGPADIFAVAGNEDELFAMIRLAKNESLPYYVIGNGSNLVVSDNGVRGLVISTAGGLSGRRILPGDNTRVYAAAGEALASVAAFCMENGLAGFEFASGIPGTLGGAVYMNAGAYGGEISSVLVSAKAFCDDNVDNMDIRELNNADLCFGYRKSILQNSGMILLSAILEFDPGTAEDIRAKMKKLNSQRLLKQPLEYPSAGSTFKRPEGEGLFAGKLISESGLAGYSIGGAKVSEKHCGFIINTGNATSSDITALIKHITAVVYEKTSILLEPEVRFMN